MKKKHDCFHFEEEPVKRERPTWAGDADTTKPGEYWDVQHKPCPPYPSRDACGVPDCGYGMPPLMPPVLPFNPNLSIPAQMEGLTCKVNELIDTLNLYSKNVYGAYNAIVHSALCNDAYYKEITIEEGYIPDASAKYKVVHIPFLDRMGEPIFLELGLAYNNSTNSGVREKSFDASQRFLADKMIPAANVGTNWYGHPIWKNAPIPTSEVEGMKYTVGITESGFIKWYPNTVDDRTMQIDKVRNAMGVRSVLISGGELSQSMWESTESTQLARVGLGMNYQTKERFIVVVEGSDRTGCTTEQFANIFKGYACDIAVECANGDASYMLDKGEMAVMPSTVNAQNIPTVPESNCFWYITKRRHYKNQYVKDVAALTQRVGQEIWNTELADTAVDKVKASVVDLNNRVTEEVNRLDDRINDETSNRQQEVARLDKRIDSEAEERKNADDALDKRIDDEIEDRTEGDTALDNRITREVKTLNDRIDSEVKTLNDRIDSEVEKLNAADTKLREDLANEQKAREDADIESVELIQDGTKDTYRLKKHDGTVVETSIEVFNYALLVKKLDTLSQFEVRLEAEIEARKNADDALSGRIDAEIDDRKAADTALQKNIDDNKTAGDTALTKEINDRTAADNQLQQNIDANKTAADTALAKEVSDREAADRALETAMKKLITAEETARKAEDSALADSIADVLKQLNAYKTTNDADIAGIELDIESLSNTVSNLSKTVSSNKTELEQKISDLSAKLTADETTISKHTQDITDLNSKVNNLQQTVSALNETVTALQAAFASTEQSFENVKQTVASLQQEMNTFEENVQKQLDKMNTDLLAELAKYLPLIGGVLSGRLTAPEYFFTRNQMCIKSYSDEGLGSYRGNDFELIPFHVKSDSNLNSAVNNEVLNTTLLDYLPLSGGVMSGNLDLNDNGLVGIGWLELKAPNGVGYLAVTEDSDGKVKKYSLTGGATGNVLVPLEIGTPINKMEAANKKYVDDTFNGFLIKESAQISSALFVTSELSSLSGSTLLMDYDYIPGTTASTMNLMSCTGRLYDNGTFLGDISIVCTFSAKTSDNKYKIGVMAYNPRGVNVTLSDKAVLYLSMYNTSI